MRVEVTIFLVHILGICIGWCLSRLHTSLKEERRLQYQIQKERQARAQMEAADSQTNLADTTGPNDPYNHHPYLH